MAGMIVTLTANPSLDRTVTLAAPLRVGEVQVAAGSREDAGGKGINVARAISAGGLSSTAVLPLAPDDPFASVLRASAAAVRAVPVRGHARTNLAVTDPSGVTTKLNLPGAALSETECDQLTAAVVAACADARWLVLAGSLPPGAPVDLYVRIIRAVRTEYAARAPLIAVDASGAALAAVVEHGRPDLIKPNDEELVELAGLPSLPGEPAQAVADIATALVPDGVGAALVTLGSHGAVLVNGQGAWHATPPPIRVVSTVGAGDSSLAGYLLAEARGELPQERLALAVRYGAAAASLAGTQAPHPTDLPSGDVPVTRLR